MELFSFLDSSRRRKAAAEKRNAASRNRPRKFEALEERRVLSAMPGPLALEPIATYRTGTFDGAATEIVAYDAEQQQIYSTNLSEHTIDVLKLSSLRVPHYREAPGPSDVPSIPNGHVKQINMSDYLDGSMTSVAVKDGLVAVSARNDMEPGQVALFRSVHKGLEHIATVNVGVGPDSVTFTPDGSKILTPDEGAPDYEADIDPEGSVSIIDVSALLDGQGQDSVTLATFTDFNDDVDVLRDAGVRIYGPGATVAMDLEPEYITVSPDSTTAFVTLQENNAIAIVDIESATVTAIKPLGTKDLSIPGNGIDASDKDGVADIKNWPVKSYYGPDAISNYVVDGELYLLTANEGDLRDFEEVRAAGLTLDETAFPNADELQSETEMGRLKVSSVEGDTDGDGDYDELFGFGGRSFSIWNAADIVQTYDSGDGFEQKTAQLIPDGFNASNDTNEFDNRSDDKGPEPSTVVVGEIDGTPYAFTALERTGGVIVYDVSDPFAPTFETYVNNRDFGVQILVSVPDPDDPTEEIEIPGPNWQDTGDLHVEGLVFISAEQSPTHHPLIVTANEVSGTVTIFQVTQQVDYSADFDWSYDRKSQSPKKGRASAGDDWASAVDMMMSLL